MAEILIVVGNRQPEMKSSFDLSLSTLIIDSYASILCAYFQPFKNYSRPSILLDFPTRVEVGVFWASDPEVLHGIVKPERSEYLDVRLQK